MTLYVESNFVLEIALGQEELEHAERLLVAAEQSSVEIVLPTFALSEPFSTVTGRTRERGRLIRQLKTQVGQLTRSSPHQQDVASLRPIPDVVARIDKREADRLMWVIERLLGATRRIEFDLAVFRAALAYRTHFGLAAQDAIILAAVVADLRVRALAGPHVFANRNHRDFDLPGVHTELRPLDCTMVFSFEEAGRLLGV